MDDHTCSVEDCARPLRAHEWCDTHYRRWLRNGSLDLAESAATRLVERACAGCGRWFLPERSNAQRFCATECRESSKWRRRPRLPCSVCGESTGYVPGWKRDGESIESATCNACRPEVTARKLAERQAVLNAECAWCGKPFHSNRRAGGKMSRFCSRSCGRRNQAGRTGRDPEKLRAKWEKERRKRRAILASAAHESYTLDEIAERDDFRCHLCGDSVDMSVRWPDPFSASIDHVVPISLGGDDVPGNVKLAHLGENVTRGNMRVSEWVSSRAPGLAIG